MSRMLRYPTWKLSFFFFYKCLLIKHFIRRLLPQKWSMGAFTQGGNWLLFNWSSFCFALKPINLWIYFQNFCNFTCMLMNARKRAFNFLFTSVTRWTCLKRHFLHNLALPTCCKYFFKKWRKVPFKTSQTCNQYKDHSLEFTVVHAKL